MTNMRDPSAEESEDGNTPAVGGEDRAFVDPEESRRSSLSLVAIAAIPLVLILILAAILGWRVIPNTLAFNEWKSQLHDAAPPDGAAVTASGSEFGLLVGNGNHCDARAWIVVDAPKLSEGLVRGHYLIVLSEGSGPQLSVTQGAEVGTYLISMEELGLVPATGDFRCG